MASETKLKIVVDAQDNTQQGFNSAESGFGKLSSAAKKLGVVLAATFAVKKIIDFGASAVSAFSEAEAAAERMTHILRTSVDATDEQIDALKRQADALEKVGVVGKDAILIGQGQLASFDLQVESIERLIPSILNYAVAENGANVSGEQLKAVTNGLAQALNGNFASLTKTGFVLDEATKKMLSTGTETEKVAALVSVLDSTYAGLNERMRETTEGRMLALQFAVGNLKETIGGLISQALLPVLALIVPLVEKVSNFVEQFKSLSDVSSFLMENFRSLMETLDLQTGLVTSLREAWDGVVFVFQNTLLPSLQELWEKHGPLLAELGRSLALVFGTALVIALKLVIDALTLATMIITGILTAGTELIDAILTKWNEALDSFARNWDRIKSAVEAVADAIRSVIELAGRVGGRISGAIGGAFGGGRASGGPVSRGTSYLVGEEGPEMFTPSSSGAIIPHGRMTGGGGITVNINGGMYLSEDAAERIGDLIIGRLRMSNAI